MRGPYPGPHKDCFLCRGWRWNCSPYRFHSPDAGSIELLWWHLWRGWLDDDINNGIYHLPLCSNRILFSLENYRLFSFHFQHSRSSVWLPLQLVKRTFTRLTVMYSGKCRFRKGYVDPSFRQYHPYSLCEYYYTPWLHAIAKANLSNYARSIFGMNCSIWAFSRWPKYQFAVSTFVSSLIGRSGQQLTWQLHWTCATGLPLSWSQCSSVDLYPGRGTAGMKRRTISATISTHRAGQRQCSTWSLI